MDHRRGFAKALRAARRARGMTQEDFDGVSSRTYVSSLERAEKSPTLDKVAELAAAMSLHPVTLIVLAWTAAGSSDKLLVRVQEELELVRRNAQAKG